jgi:hypothetical protein
LATFRPVAKEVLSILRRVNPTDFDLSQRDTGIGQLINVGLPEIKVWVAVRAIGVGEKLLSIAQFDQR